VDGAEHVHSGKVRDLYRLPDGRLLMVASDRISAFDHILDSTIPDKGVVLTRMSLWWFEQLADLVPHHVLSTDVPEHLRGRAVVCEALEMFPVECVARGYLTGSGLLDYRASGEVCGISLPPGLEDGSRLPETLFTPATKAELGEHDENIDFDTAAEAIGNRPLMEELRRISIEIYKRGADHAAEKGILLADTKFEFGSSPDAEIVLADEVLTPDSSRFWPADSYEPGGTQPSFDKQYVRDYSDSVGWDHTDPGPELPDEVVENTRAKYVEAYEKITGRKLG
jgi:phosphoribosylaminoimidazole-succinocarboxamide synthase